VDTLFGVRAAGCAPLFDAAGPLDAALAAAKAFDEPGLIVAQVNAHGLPKELQ
jgi:hypothetical protein